MTIALARRTRWGWMSAMLLLAPGLTGRAAEEPSDLVRLRQQREAGMKRIDDETAAKKQQVDQIYLSSLDALYKQYIARKDVSSAALIKAERDRVAGIGAGRADAGRTGPGAAGAFDWAAARPGLTYWYKENTFGTGQFDYSDRQNRKLLDGQTAPTHSGHSVGWLRDKPSPICFEFRSPVRPAVVRVHVQGGNMVGSVMTPRGIRISEGTTKAPGRAIGEGKRFDEQTGWVEIPLLLDKPVSVFWIEIDKSSAQWSMIDEVEFR